MKCRNKQSGFTLLEMIVALAIAGLLVSLAYGALRIGIRSWESSQLYVDENDAMRISWQFLHHSLRETKATHDPLEKKKHLLFKGTATSLLFTADMPSHLGLGGLYVIQVKTQGNDPQQLLLSRTLLSEYKQPNTENHPQQAVLVDELKQIEIAYYGQTSEKGAYTWQSTWLDRKTLPQLVRINIKQQNGKNWPILIAHLQLGYGRGLNNGEINEAETDELSEAGEIF